MNPNVNKPMFSDRYGNNVRTHNNDLEPVETKAKGEPFQNPYDAPSVAIEGEANTGLNEHNYFGKNMKNKNNFKEYIDETSKEGNTKMVLVVVICSILIVTIVGCSVAFFLLQ